MENLALHKADIMDLSYIYRMFRSRFTDVDGVVYHHEEYPGPGEKVLLIHGFASSCYTWRSVAENLHGLGFHVYALDMMGFGWSDKPSQAEYDALSLMEGVAAWMDAVGLDSAVVGGNSLGGGVASLLALMHPEKVSRLILVDALIPYADIAFPFLLKLARFPFAGNLARFVITPATVRATMRQIFYDPRLVTPGKVEAYHQRLSTPGCLEAQVKLARSLDPARFAKYLEMGKKMTVPALVIWGEEDRWLPVRFGHRLVSERRARGRFVVLSRCGHMPQEEMPRATARLMADFLEGLPLRESNGRLYAHVEDLVAA
ncbi:MAG: alpha/beta hydrolase [Thermodesulfobacteriota bacterium]